MTDYGAYDHSLPCKNPSCKSEGRPHPNCHCYAAGGAVHFCSTHRAHDVGCKFFRDGGPVPPPLYAEGGDVDPETADLPAPVAPVAAAEPPDDVAGTLGLAGAHQGLLALMQSTGRAKLPDAEKHGRVLEEAKLQHGWREAPLGNPLKKTLGARLGDKLADRDHEGAAELVQGHPLFGRAGKTALKPIVGRLHGPLMSREVDAEAFRGAADYLHSAVQGHGKVEDRVKHFFDRGAKPLEADKESTKALSDHLDELQENPEAILEIGGKLGHYLPEHGATLAAHVMAAATYLETLKPKPQQMGPLDEALPVSRGDEARYERQLGVAQDPLLVLQYAKDGTIQPQDLATLSTIYPGLTRRIVQEASNRLIETKSDGKDLTYRQKQGLSAILGQPLDYTQTPAAAQAIMKAQGPQQVKNQGKQKPKGREKATAAELKQINRVDELSETPLESRIINKNRR